MEGSIALTAHLKRTLIDRIKVLSIRTFMIGPMARETTTMVDRIRHGLLAMCRQMDRPRSGLGPRQMVTVERDKP